MQITDKIVSIETLRNKIERVLIAFCTSVMKGICVHSFLAPNMSFRSIFVVAVFKRFQSALKCNESDDNFPANFGQMANSWPTFRSYNELTT